MLSQNKKEYETELQIEVVALHHSAITNSTADKIDIIQTVPMTHFLYVVAALGAIIGGLGVLLTMGHCKDKDADIRVEHNKVVDAIAEIGFRRAMAGPANRKLPACTH